MKAPLLPNPSERRAARLAVFAGALRDAARFGAATLAALAAANVAAPEQAAPLNVYAAEYGRFVWLAASVLAATFIVSRLYEERNDLARGDAPEDALVRVSAELAVERGLYKLKVDELERLRATIPQEQQRGAAELLRRYGCTEADLQSLQVERALRALADEHGDSAAR